VNNSNVFSNQNLNQNFQFKQFKSSFFRNSTINNTMNQYTSSSPVFFQLSQSPQQSSKSQPSQQLPQSPSQSSLFSSQLNIPSTLSSSSSFSLNLFGNTKSIYTPIAKSDKKVFFTTPYQIQQIILITLKVKVLLI
jgi:hypothetical protein